MMLVMKILWLLLMKKRNIESWKKALEWWIVAEKFNLIEEDKKIGINEVIKRNEIKIINTCKYVSNGH